MCLLAPRLLRTCTATTGNALPVVALGLVVYVDLLPRSLSLGDRYALYRYLHALLGNDDSLPVGAHALAHPHRPGLALAGADLELLLRAAHPVLLLVSPGGVRPGQAPV